MKKIFFLVVLSFTATINFSRAQTGTIITVAGGSGWASYAGDGLPATDASVRFMRTTGVTVDAAGNLYIVDWMNARVRKVDAVTGILSTFAGNGVNGNSGDGGPATAAQIDDYSYGACTDNSGNIYFVQYLSPAIRKINAATGIISTVAGNGSTASPVNGVPATNSPIYRSNSVYVDVTGNIYFSDMNMIRKVDISTGIVNTITGIHSKYITGDNYGNLYTSDSNKIIKINAVGVATTIAGTGVAGYSGDGGPATSAKLNTPRVIGLDGAGNFYICDNDSTGTGVNSNYIRKIDATTGTITTVAGCNCTGPALHFSAPVPATSVKVKPQDICVDVFGNLYYSDYSGWVNKIILSPSTCSGMPIPGVITVTSSIATCATTLYNTGISPGVTLQWQSSSDSISWVNITGATSYSYSFSSFSSARYYRCVATCSASGLSAYTAPVHILPVRPLSHTVINPPDTVCTGPDFYVNACGVSSAYTVKTYFGDGTNSVTPLSSAGISEAHIFHNYYCAGVYSVKQVLYNGGSAIDSVSFTYNYSYCKTFPVKFYFDANFNCVYDAGDVPNHLPVTVEVDSNGVAIDIIPATSGFFYKAKGAPGTVYAFRILSLPSGLHITCPASAVLYDTVQYYVNNYPEKYFGMNCASSAAFDLSVSGLLRFAAHSGLGDMVVNNSYCTPENATLTLNFNAKYPFNSSHPAPASVLGNTVTWNFSNVSATISSPIYIHIQFGHAGIGFQPAGDTIHTSLNVTPMAGDVNVVNNTDNREDTVKYAFDPNEISVSNGCIPVDSQLQYTIHFENTGNDTAHNIYVLDTLSEFLDSRTINIVAVSALMNITVTHDAGYNIVKFDFPGINLLDSSHHNECSGMVIYNIKILPGIPFDATVFNEAGIYFDENPVVMTNTVGSSFKCPITTGVATNKIQHLEIFPNPTTDELTIKMEPNAYTSFTISNSMGQVLIEQPLTGARTKTSVKMLPPGMYYVTVKGDNGNSVRKFIKM